MKLSARKVRGTEVLLMDKKTPIALIRGLIFDASNGNLLGINVGLNKVICAYDLNFDEENKVFYVKSSDSICLAKDVVRIDKCLKSKNYFNKQTIFTESGKKIGRLYDVNFEPVLGIIKEIVAHKGIFLTRKRRIIPKYEIINVSEKQIIIKDDGEKIPVLSKKLKNKAAPVTGAALSDLLTN